MSIFKFKNLICERFVLGPFQVNSYIIYHPASKDALIVDPAEASPVLSDRISELGIEKSRIFLTHGHGDHILGVPFLKEKTGAKLICSPEDARMLEDPMLNLSIFFGQIFSAGKADEFISHGDKIYVGGEEGAVVGIPGHTQGGLALVFSEFVISGDSLFAGSIGRSDFPGGNGELLIEMIRARLLTLEDRIVLPGHGPETRLADEKAENPFVGD